MKGKLGCFLHAEEIRVPDERELDCPFQVPRQGSRFLAQMGDTMQGTNGEAVTVQRPAQPMVEDQLLMSLVFEAAAKSKWSRRKRIATPLQGAPFRVGVRVKNVASTLFPGGKIKGGAYRSVGGITGAVQEIIGEFSIPSLDSGKETTIWMTTERSEMAGLLWLSLQLVPTEGHKIMAFQEDAVTGRKERFANQNEWGELFRIQEEHAFAQRRTNVLIAILTGVTVWDGLIGISETVQALRASVAWALEALAKFIG